MKAKTLVIDIGNTSTSLGIFSNGTISRRERMDTPATQVKTTRGAIAELIGDRQIEKAVVASVVPKVNRRWENAIRSTCGIRPLWVSPGCNLGIKITYPKPETIGPDRLANATAAAARYGVPVVVADFGTALTFDIVARRHGYIGGIITPGLPLMLDYLAEKTALLPRIEPAPVRTVVGKSTEHAMRIGARVGYRGMVREILQEIRKKLGWRGMKVCATGGYAPWVLKDLGIDVVFDKDLTLYGLGHIGDLNG